MRYRISLILAVVLAAGTWAKAAVDVTPLRTLPVLDHGRIKPIDTVARETVSFVTGYEYFGPVKTDADGSQTMGDRMDPLALAIDWAAHPVAWQTQPVLYVPRLDLRAKLHMKESQKWISARQLMEDTEFNTWVHGLEDERQAAEKNNETLYQRNSDKKLLEDAGVELDGRLRSFEAASELSIYCILPSDGPKSTVWIPLSGILALTGQDAQTATPIMTAWNGIVDAYNKGDDKAFAAASGQLQQSVIALTGPDYADSASMDREVFYNWFKPFRKVWILYFTSIIVLIGALMTPKKSVYAIGMGVAFLAILFHAGAFGLRCSITGWAPVATMYETLVWVSLMTAVFACTLEIIYNRRIIMIGGAVVAILAAIIADAIPPELGKSINPLRPVLRSNYWLMIHVLTIVSSYAAFALALVLGNIVLGQFIYGKSKPESVRSNLLFTYRAVQIGVLLVASGTILGGLWADVSWGRFWGWDPKEVWALIVLLTYLALLHGRFAGWIKQFGMAAGAVFCFTAVVMSWYGVNFVLGAGLHSYGFGSGGIGYVMTFVLLQWAYVAVAWVVYRSRQPKLEVAPTTGSENIPLVRGAIITGK